MKFAKSVKRASFLLGLVCMLGLFANPHPVSAQNVYGSLYGTVFDKTGAVIPNATVTIKSQQKDTTATAQSNANSQYRIDHLAPDSYTVTISAPSFKAFTVSNLQNVQFAGAACIDCSTGGLITAMATGFSPRQLEFAAKIRF